MLKHRQGMLVHVALGTLLAAAPAAAWQAPQPGGTSDTLYLSLPEARALAVQGNPAYLAEAARIGVAEGALREAGTFRFNPEAEAEFPGSLSGEGSGAYEVLVSQTLEWAGQRGLRVDAARAALDGAGSTLAEASMLLVQAVTEAYYSGLAADRRLEVSEGTAGLNQRLLDAVEVQLREGEISVMEANFVEIEAARSLARVLTARREARSAALTLGRLLGVSEGTVVKATEASQDRLPDPSLMALDRLVDAALTLRPDVRSRVHRLRESETLARLARREAIPDLGVGALVSGGDAEPSTRVGLQVSLSLPTWNRNQGLVAARDADVRGAALDLEAIELTVRSQVADAYQAYVAASEEEALILERVLEPARGNQELLDAAYREGEMDLPSLVLLRNQLFDAEIGYWEAWLARRHSLARLRTAVGDLETDLEAL